MPSQAPLHKPGANNHFCHAETDDTYDDDSGSEVSLEVGAEAGADFEAQQRLHAASVAQSGPATATGEPAAVPPHQSMLRRFSKDHAVSEDIQKRFMIAVENDEKAAKTRVQDWLVQPLSPPPPPLPLALGFIAITKQACVIVHRERCHAVCCIANPAAVSVPPSPSSFCGCGMICLS